MNETKEEPSLLIRNLTVDRCAEVSNLTNCFTPYAMRPETYIVPVVFVHIFIVGLIGNGTIITILFKENSMRSVPSMYVNLCLLPLFIIVLERYN